jgi:hypothetical protein
MIQAITYLPRRAVPAEALHLRAGSVRVINIQVLLQHFIRQRVHKDILVCKVPAEISAAVAALAALDK